MTTYPLFAAPDAPPADINVTPPPTPTAAPTTTVDLDSQTIILSLTLRAPGATRNDPERGRLTGALLGSVFLFGLVSPRPLLWWSLALVVCLVPFAALRRR